MQKNKKLINIFLSSIFCFTTLVSSCTSSDSLYLSDELVSVQNIPNNQREYTLLTYQSLDNDLGDIYNPNPSDYEPGQTIGQVNNKGFESDLLALESIVSDNIKVYGWFDFFNGNNVKKDTVITEVSSNKDFKKPKTILKSVRERNSAYYRNLEKFIKEGIKKLPSKKVILDIGSHGLAYKGTSPDDSSSVNTDYYKRISLEGLRLAIEKGLNGKKLDILTFYACLMSNVEVMYQIRNNVNILIASSDVMDVNYNPKTSFYRGFDIINQNNKIDDESLAKHLVDYISNQELSSTMTASYPSKVVPLVQELDSLANILIQKLPQNKNLIVSAILSTKKYPFNFDMELESQREKAIKEGKNYTEKELIEISNRAIDLVDIKEFTKQLRKKFSKDNNLLQACDKVDSSVDNTIISVNTDKPYIWGGISIYLPIQGKVDNTYFKTEFAKNTRWDQFLNLLLKN
jgi:hypothetical protein